MAKKKPEAPAATPPTGPNKIAIVGTTTHRKDAPYDDDTWDIWGCARWSEEVKRWDRWFEIHDLAAFSKDYDDHLKYLRESGKPVYVKETTEKMPSGIVFPRAHLIEKFGGTYFFTSTIAWMMALALDHLNSLPKDRPRVLGIWGVDMASHGEYKSQKPGCKHFMVMAKMMGIELVVAKGSDLLIEPAPYPDLPGLLEIKIRNRSRELEKVLDHGKDILRKTELEVARLNGMKANQQYYLDNWTEDRGT